MQYCPTCHVRIRGSGKRCVLCGNLLPARQDGEEEEIFPQIPFTYSRHLALRILAFLSLCAVIVSFTVRFMVPTRINWPMFVAFGLSSLWLCIIIVLRKRHNLPKTILWQSVMVSILSLFWDWLTGWKNWSLDYLVPIVFIVSAVLLYLTAKIQTLGVRDYITYILLDGVLGMVPIAFILLNWVDTPYPSILCAAVSIVLLSGVLIFQWDSIRKELGRKMHL
jgi:hypothetical protein